MGKQAFFLSFLALCLRQRKRAINVHKEDQMRRYETISIISPNIGEDEIKAISQKTAGIIESDGGTIIYVDNWGLKKLAYPIKKQQQGYYVYTEFAAVPSAVNEMERIFKIDDHVLKFMTVKLQEVYDPNTPVKSSISAKSLDIEKDLDEEE
jgi:small subunit ribosomal protein S6